MVHILHIDTSGKTGLVMLASEGKPAIVRENYTEKDHAATINILIGEVLREAGLNLTDINAIAVCTGPGSYTGLRIGMATAKGICYAIDKPLICNNKLELLPVDTEDGSESDWISILPARDGEYFFLENDANCKYGPVHLLTEEVNEHLKNNNKEIKIFGIIGQDIIKQKNLIFNDTEKINVISWSKMAYVQFTNQTFANIATVEPLYLKQVFINKKP